VAEPPLPQPRPFAVDPLGAIAYLRNKTAVPTERWSDLWEGMHGAGFMVAGATKAGLIEDFHEAVTAAIAEGRTLEQFRADFDRIVEKHGWSYNGSRGWRSRVIFETNMRTAYAAGRWQQIQETKRARPWLRYVTVGDHRVRPQHRDWHDLVLAVDDPWWETHFPPNDWGCRCRVDTMNDRDLKRMGLKPGKAPPVRMVERTINKNTEPTPVLTPEGIGPGFAYNPGIAGFGRGANAVAVERHGGRMVELVAPGAPAPRDLPPLPVEAVAPPHLQPSADDAEFLARFRAAIGGDEAIWTDPTGARVRVGMRLAEHILADGGRQDGRDRYFPLMRGLVESPAEIWLGFVVHPQTGKVELRRRYVRVVYIEKNRVLGLVADASNGGEWSGFTFYRGKLSALDRLRIGRPLFRR
jgi:SPP1 gp7 family putative phage head morphogenesis protein